MTEIAERTTRPPAPAKVKILATATELFADHGVHNVGVDRIIGTSHVTKATFYKHYHAKDVLIVTYLQQRDGELREFVAAARIGSTPQDALTSIVDRIMTDARHEDFRGCPFIEAADPYADPQHPVRVAVSAWREWYRGVFVELLTQAGVSNPEAAADDLLLARDGALGGGNVADPAAVEASLQRALERALTA